MKKEELSIENIIHKSNEHNKIMDEIIKKNKVKILGLSGALEVLVYLSIKKDINGPLVIITPKNEGTYLYELIKNYVEKVILIKGRELSLFKTIFKSENLDFTRIKNIRKIFSHDVNQEIIIIESNALIEKSLPKEIILENTLKLTVGSEYKRESILENLLALGYEKVNDVEFKGQFSIRGDVLEIFDPTKNNPKRLHFFDDELEKIHIFMLDTKVKIEELNFCEIYPTTDIPINLGSKESLITYFSNMEDSIKGKLETEEDFFLETKVLEIKEELINGININDHKRFYQEMFNNQEETILSYLPENSLLIVKEVNQCIADNNRLYKDIITQITEGMSVGRTFEIQKNNYIPNLMEELKAEKYYVDFQLFDEYGQENSLFKKSLVPSFLGNLELLKKTISEHLQEAFTIYLVFQDENKEKEIQEYLWDCGLRDESIIYLNGYIDENFKLDEDKMLFLSEMGILGIKHKKKNTKKKSKLNSFTEINLNDFVVHEEYGICIYGGVSTKEVLGKKRDYVTLIFKGEGKLFLPIENIEYIEKYIGGDGVKPKLSNLGTNDWAKTKAKAKAAIGLIAEELIGLYSLRKGLEGFRFSPDGPVMMEFENKFPHDETEDQLRAIREIKKDMESSKPMDRILIGDVGYGKTEVAIRAACKCILDNKQAIVLCPTTILSKQHYNTFVERFKEFDVNIKVINRFISSKEEKVIINEIQSGDAQIIIGTHKLLNKKYQYHDLGLLIVDEEQKFGVTHKEKIKFLKENVDTLTLSATPIPRTLHMSLAGARDLSLIETPPKERFPVVTYVLEQDMEIIRNSILKEVRRGGQVYYVSNRVIGIVEKMKKIQSLVPECKISLAHGQMDKNQLEENMLEFVEGRSNILLCTTIIENGINIQNANTLIIENTDKLGLSQIYQLKGRVGRGNKIAYSYFFFQKDKILTDQGKKRLKAIKELTELGAGFKIAMLDLEIRGAGNLLGKEQSGHMISVGFDLYCKILEEEMEKLEKNDMLKLGTATREEEKDIPLILEIEKSGHIPSTYIEDPKIKIELYKKIGTSESYEEIENLSRVISDRFGSYPKEVEDLIFYGKIRGLCKDIGITRIKEYLDSYEITYKGGAMNLDLANKLKYHFPKQLLIKGEMEAKIRMNVKNKKLKNTELFDFLKCHNIEF